MSLIIPPIKSQGIKTKLVPWINEVILRSDIDLEKADWIEPFFGTGVVGFNSPLQGKKIVGDTNPYIIQFYDAISKGEITPLNMRIYLERESSILSTAEDDGYARFREVRNRFNCEHNPFDFIFLSRDGFNGMMRFNRKGAWNVPFRKKDHFYHGGAHIENRHSMVEALVFNFKIQDALRPIPKRNVQYDLFGNEVRLPGFLSEDTQEYK